MVGTTTKTIYFSSRHSRQRVNWITRLNRIYSHKIEEEETEKQKKLWAGGRDEGLQSLRKLSDFKRIIAQTEMSYSKVHINDSVFQVTQIHDCHVFIDLVIS